MFKEEGNYDTEYIVTKDFLEKELFDKCKMRLIETDMFENVFSGCF